MNIHKLMSKNVVTVGMDDSLQIVKDIFDKTGFHHLLVVESEKLLGIISDRDLLKSLSPKIDTSAASEKDLACLNKKAHQIMTRNPIVLNANTSVHSAVDVFNNNKISCIPITNDEDKLVGILSWRDIMKILGKNSNVVKK